MVMFRRSYRNVCATVSTVALLAVPGVAMAQQNSTVFPWQSGYSGRASRMETFYGPSYGPAPLVSPSTAQPAPAGISFGPVITPAVPSITVPDAGYVSAGTPSSPRALLVARVPANARVWIEGTPTTSTGSLRRYVSPALTPGVDYRYTVRVEWTEDGKTVTRTETVPVHAGQTADFSIGATR
jgi:uncharacterized protein (TIGR03000 family)